MSTSPSKPSDESAGIGSLFKRAIEERSQLAPPSGPVDERVESRLCTHCGAPRATDNLVCKFCGTPL
jgi:hypothetical protein